jgi:glutamate synthase domain-containing protein 2
VGFKLCIGRPIEFLSACKAMIETGIMPDFITVDGSEGGTGAAPIEFSDALGMPLREALVFVHNALTGCGLRNKIRIAASGKVTSAAGIAKNLALGADWCNVARGFMLSVGCIQAQACHTNKCPVGVATQNPSRYRAVDVENKGRRAYHFHRNTLIALNELVAAAGLRHPGQFRPQHVYMRLSRKEVISYDQAFHYVEPGAILDGSHQHPVIEKYWEQASPDCFDPTAARART